MMRHDLPPWRVVYDHFGDWCRTGKWERSNAVLGKRYRVSKGRDRQPSAAVVDSQSAKTTQTGRPRGYVGGKKVKGRKRQILADTEGSLLKVAVHPTDQHGKQGGLLLLTCLHLLFPAKPNRWRGAQRFARCGRSAGPRITARRPWRFSAGTP